MTHATSTHAASTAPALGSSPNGAAAPPTPPAPRWHSCTTHAVSDCGTAHRDQHMEPRPSGARSDCKCGQGWTSPVDDVSLQLRHAGSALGGERS